MPQVHVQHCRSVAGTLLLTEATLTEVKDEKTTSLHPEIAAGLEG